MHSPTSPPVCHFVAALRRDSVSPGHRLLRLCLLLLVGTTASPVLAQIVGSAEAGQAKAITCSACHGMDGNSVNPEWPSLAGQHESYTANSLQTFRSGERQNLLMTPMAMTLSDQDIADLAAFYAAQKPADAVADPALVTSGERLYRGGNRETGVPACIACHGPSGRGNSSAGWPVISGQHATYAAAQLRAYRARERITDGDTQMMRNISTALTDDEIRAVTSYIQGLH